MTQCADSMGNVFTVGFHDTVLAHFSAQVAFGKNIEGTQYRNCLLLFVNYIITMPSNL